MTTKTKIAVMTVVLFMTASVIGASAFTTATLERDSTIDVVSDSNGLIQLGAGNTAGVYEDTNSGELTIEMDSSTNSGINGVNPDANFTFGDASTINSSNAESKYVYAFKMNVTEPITGSGDLTLSYTDDGNADENVQFRVYKAGANGGIHETTATEKTDGTFSPTEDTTYYVVLIIDTGETTTDLTKGDSLNGTLTISVN